MVKVVYIWLSCMMKRYYLIANMYMKHVKEPKQVQYSFQYLIVFAYLFQLLKYYILKKKDIIPDILTAHQDTIGIRIPKENIARKLIDYAGVPIATTSANISGEQSGTKLNDIIKVFKNRADFFIDGGESKLGTASTIVKVVDGVPEILRQGPITKTQIDDLKI